VLREIRAYLIDRDGVLTEPSSGKPITGADIWLQRLIKKEKKFLVATNHTTSSPSDAAEKLRSRGFEVKASHIHTPLSILRSHFKAHDPGRLLVLGTGQLKNYLADQGLELVDSYNSDTLLMGFDRNLQPDDLKKAVHAVHAYDADIIALHENRLYKDDRGNFEPGLGAWVRAIEYATGKKALIIGKPSEFYYKTSLLRLEAVPEQTVMISDDPLSDLGGAKKMGIRTVFVTSGKYVDESILKQMKPELRPDLILHDITEFSIED